MTSAFREIQFFKIDSKTLAYKKPAKIFVRREAGKGYKKGEAALTHSRRKKGEMRWRRSLDWAEKGNLPAYLIPPAIYFTYPPAPQPWMSAF